MLLLILTIFHILVCIVLIGVVLMQRSEGGALGMGGGPSGFMTARGAGDLLTRTTWILFAAFLTLSVALTFLGARSKNASGLKIDRIDPSAIAPARPQPAAPLPGQANPSGLPDSGGIPGVSPSEAQPSPLTAPSNGGLDLSAPPAAKPAPATPAKK